MIEGSTPDAIAFLRAWAPAGPWVLTAIDPNREGDAKQRIQTKTFSPQQEREASVWLGTWQGKRNIYFSANQPGSDRSKKAKKEHIAHALCFHVDVDPAKPPADCPDFAAHYAAELERILPLLQSYVPPPTVIVYSGGGYQGFWKLREPLDINGPEDVSAVELRNRRIEKDLGGDHCFNLDRIMRLPGTVNVPNAQKVRQGRVPTLAGVVEAEWSTLYSVEDFRPLEVAETPKEKAPPPKSSKAPKREPTDWCRRLILNGNDLEGPRSYGGDRSKAVFAVACSLVRSGWEDEDIARVLLDREHKISGHVLDQGSPQQYALKQAKNARDKVGSDFSVNDKGKPVGNQFNLRLALAKLEVEISYNAFSNKLFIEGPHGEPARYYDDPEENRLYLMVDEVFGFRPAFEFFHKVMVNEGRFNLHHPVLDYLDGLSWDGKERLDSWLPEYGGAVDTPYSRAVGSIMMIAAVKRVRQPGCKFDEMMVFDSGQGTNKSTALEIMAVKEEWFTDSLPLNAEGKEVIEAIGGKWIVEAGELKGMRGAAIEHLKGFLSRKVDRGRLAYGKHQSEVPRQCVFFGTTNSMTYLRDDANRRFWPIHVELFDIARLRRDRDQIWAEAAAREAAGESVRLDPALWPFAAAEQMKRAIDEPWLGVIESTLGRFDAGKILVTDIWEVVNIPVGLRTQDHNARIGEAMKTLGWERKQLRYEGKPRWHYTRGTDAEQLTRIAILRDRETNALRVEAWEEGAPNPFAKDAFEPV